MWHKADRMGHPIRQGFIIVIYRAIGFDVVQGRMNGAPK